ncbi:hypothetical protein [Caballeronia terrestris]|uniref:hypothetical protein n=1 Tax=Caballeronia terrestris TaxID=1226301 RepID=UPI000F73A528|nr:hypothetical protein [Caballeronia terrestris]
MLTWTDPIVPIPSTETSAFRRLTRTVAPDRAAVKEQLVLLDRISQTAYLRYANTVLLRAIEVDPEFSTPWSRNAIILRAVVLRRCLAELRSRTLKVLASDICLAKSETGGAHAIAKRRNPLGAPPQAA